MNSESGKFSSVLIRRRIFTELAVFVVNVFSNLLNINRLCSCKFEPSCSKYAGEALRRHGFLAASRLVLIRVIRCNPFRGAGYDPVPEPNLNPDSALGFR